MMLDNTREPGQIDEFVRSHGGAWVHRVAFRTDDITAAIRAISSSKELDDAVIVAGQNVYPAEVDKVLI